MRHPRNTCDRGALRGTERTVKQAHAHILLEPRNDYIHEHKGAANRARTGKELPCRRLAATHKYTNIPARRAEAFEERNRRVALQASTRGSLASATLPKTGRARR